MVIEIATEGGVGDSRSTEISTMGSADLQSRDTDDFTHSCMSDIITRQSQMWMMNGACLEKLASGDRPKRSLSLLPRDTKVELHRSFPRLLVTISEKRRTSPTMHHGLYLCDNSLDPSQTLQFIAHND